MKIFIIEDEPAIREELVQLLQKYGYQCDSSDDFHHIVQRISRTKARCPACRW